MGSNEAENEVADNLEELSSNPQGPLSDAEIQVEEENDEHDPVDTRNKEKNYKKRKTKSELKKEKKRKKRKRGNSGEENIMHDDENGADSNHEFIRKSEKSMSSAIKNSTSIPSPVAAPAAGTPTPASTPAERTVMPSVKEVCATYGLNDAKIQYTKADYQNMTSYKFYAQHVRDSMDPSKKYQKMVNKNGLSSNLDNDGEQKSLSYVFDEQSTKIWSTPRHILALQAQLDDLKKHNVNCTEDMVEKPTPKFNVKPSHKEKLKAQADNLKKYFKFRYIKEDTVKKPTPKFCVKPSHEEKLRVQADNLKKYFKFRYIKEDTVEKPTPKFSFIPS